MAAPGCASFSPDGEYFAFTAADGKLRVWETASGRLKQEYVSSAHLSAPCRVLSWIAVGTGSNATPSPWKKRRRKLTNEAPDHKNIIAMGSTNGKITLYDTSTSSVSATLENGHTGSVSALTWSESTGLISAGEDYQLAQWNLQENCIRCKWKSGKGKVTSLAVTPDGNSFLSAERVVKWWDLETKKVIKTFTGHANQVTCLSVVRLNAENCYAISGANGDNCLGVWPLNEKSEPRTAANLATQDEPISVSSLVSSAGQVSVLVTTRSGQAQLFHFQPNGRLKPLKPTLSVAVAAAEAGQGEPVQPIPILASNFTLDERLLLTYGSFLSPVFERISPDFSNKVQCLVRTDGRKKEKRDENIAKVKSTIIEGDVEYLAPGSVASPTSKRNRSSSGSQLLLQDRLENLSLSGEATMPGRCSVKGNMAQLLMQGLNSKDRNILSNVLFTKNETVVKNTIAKLPVQALGPLLKELTSLLQGKTYASRTAVMWLQASLTTHAAHFLSRPDVAEAFSPILSHIDAKLALLPELSRLRGRVSLLTGQIRQANEEAEKDLAEESVVVYQDPDSSDEDAMEEDEPESESDENWDELSEQDEEQEEQEEQEARSGDENESICS